MATFPSITPTYGAQKTSQPKVRQVQFGDGYSQRLTVGLNQDPKVWSLTWEVSETDSDTIEAFLDARAADGASFTWTPPDEATAYQWTFYDWSKSIPYLNRATIQATFTQVFEPTP
jgi:phage-related protein